MDNKNTQSNSLNSCTCQATQTMVTKPRRCILGLVVLVVSREACCGPPTASLRGGAGVQWVVLAGTHQCATESRMTLWQSANAVRAVGASPVILSPLKNVCASLSSVMVFRIVKLKISKQIATHVFCGTSEYLHKHHLHTTTTPTHAHTHGIPPKYADASKVCVPVHVYK